ncbi:hypothetical protein HMPREF0185_02304 [Brevundimonas diminuta 470-4]|nr:hypothetical protein HMPREF0185_02304 [Brevundimonas diminuta 470-4]
MFGHSDFLHAPTALDRQTGEDRRPAGETNARRRQRIGPPRVFCNAWLRRRLRR